MFSIDIQTPCSYAAWSCLAYIRLNLSRDLNPAAHNYVQFPETLLTAEPLLLSFGVSALQAPLSPA